MTTRADPSRAASIERVLAQWSLARLDPARASRGPLVMDRRLTTYASTGPEVLAAAHVPDAASDAFRAALLETARRGGFGLNLDLDGYLATITAVRELHVIFEPVGADFGPQLNAMGFTGSAGIWRAHDPDWRIPQGGAEWGGQVFPCLGYVGDQGQPPQALRHVSGFYVAALPPGVAASHASRGHHFVHDIETRGVERMRVVVALDTAAADMTALLEYGLAALFCGGIAA